MKEVTKRQLEAAHVILEKRLSDLETLVQMHLLWHRETAERKRGGD